MNEEEQEQHDCDENVVDYEFISMTELPKKLQKKYLKELKKEN